MSDDERTQATVWLFNYLVVRWLQGHSANIAIERFMRAGIISDADGLVTADKAEFFHTRGVEEIVRLLDVMVERGPAAQADLWTE